MKGGTYRRGRTVVSVTSQKSNDQVYACIAISLTILFLILLPSFNLSNEIILKDSKILSKEVNDKVINIHNKNKKIDDMIHINGGEYESTVSDPSFGITLNHGVNLKRKTEYCQWHEHSISHKKCTGTGDKKKCITKKTYHYIKSWTSYPINSLFFDQPAAHHNPQRNPYPSEQFTTSNLVLYEDHNPTMMKIDSNILTNLKNSKYHPIDFTLNGIKKTSHDISQFTSLFNNIFGNFLGLTSSTETLSSIEQTRYEDINQLKISSINSLATKNDGFYYVGNGFFFSPYQSDLITQISKTFFGYLEGSLFDWQLGDLISSCTPGDIRVKYEIQDPDTISVLGIINEKSVLANNNHDNIQQQQNEKLYISNYESKNIDKYKLGISVGGSMSASKMMDDVIYDNWYNLFLTRVLLLPWSFVISKIIFSFFGIELRNGYTSYHNNNEKKTTTFIISLLGLLGIWTSFVGFCDFITHIDSFISNNNIDFQIENDSNNIHNLNQENEEEEENIYHILSYDELQSLYNRLIILFSFSMISLIYVIKKAARCKKSGFKASWSVLKQLLKIETDSTTCMGSCDSKEIKE